MARILVVDDDPDLSHVVADVLRHRGHKVTVAHDGKHGMHILNDMQPLPDLVVLDVEMPRMSGPEMAHRMLIDDCGKENVPLVFMSARQDIGEIAQRHGTPFYIHKGGAGFRVERLLETIDKALEMRVSPAGFEPA